MKTPRGLVLFQGPSKLDGTDITVVAVLKSANRKTGNMVQVYILCTDTLPTEALKLGLDLAICGHCPHRNSTCYVNVGQSVNSVWRALQRGAYPMATIESMTKLVKGRAVRFGAYGDPAAAPTWIWRTLAQLASTHTGYTHQSRHKSFDPVLAQFVMISADSPKQAQRSQVFGQRTFRVKNADDTLLPNEIECLADSHGMQCIDCGLCDGAQSNSPSIAITVHGASASKFKTANIIATSGA